MTTLRILERLTLAVTLLLAVSGCTSIKNTLGAIPMPSMPNIHMPKVKLPDVTKVIPGMGTSGDAISSDDPLMPFNFKGTLGYGHTLRLAVYDGIREPRKLFSGLVMIDKDGIATFDKAGSAKLGGHTIPECRRMIESVFRRTGEAASRMHVHVISIENTPLVTIEGDVVAPTTTPLWKGMKLEDAITMAGGRLPGSIAQAVYVTQNGLRRFYKNDAAASQGSPLHAGDIITLSPDL